MLPPGRRTLLISRKEEMASAALSRWRKTSVENTAVTLMSGSGIDCPSVIRSSTFFPVSTDLAIRSIPSEMSAA